MASRTHLREACDIPKDDEYETSWIGLMTASSDLRLLRCIDPNVSTEADTTRGRSDK